MEHVRGIFVLLIIQVLLSGYKIKIPSDSSQESHTMNYVNPACFLQPVHSDFLRMQQTQRVEPAKLLNHETHTGK